MFPFNLLKQICKNVLHHLKNKFTWHISHIIIDIQSLIVITCILTQSNNHWLLNDALNVVISTNLKLKKNMNHFLLLDALIDDDDFGLNIEMGTFAMNIKKETINIIDYFLSFLTRYGEKITHDMLALTLNPKFKR
jgi:hypothetical protein